MLINKDIEDYINDHLDEEDNLLSELYRYTNLNVINACMISGHEQGRLLAMLSKMIKPKQILEIGTFTGYSAICLCEGLAENGHLHTIEINDELADIAQLFFEKAGLSDRISLHICNALDIIPKIDAVFDLVFIDASKKQYIEYYDAVFDKVAIGGYILIDNILWYGKVANPQAQDDVTIQLREFNKMISNDKRIEKSILTNRDGLFLIRKNLNDVKY